MPIFIHLSLLDILSVGWFLLLWAGYSVYVLSERHIGETVYEAVNVYRLRWMREMIQREVRIADTQIVNGQLNVSSFFASTSVFIMAGVGAALSSSDTVLDIVREVPWSAATDKAAIQIKLLVMVIIFAYSFFKFTWAIRQFTYTMILIGAAPPLAEVQRNPEAAELHGLRAATISTIGNKHFNAGIRGYYFGMASLGWFLHPLLFMAVTAWVVMVLHRRDFRSQTLAALRNEHPGMNVRS